MGAAQGRRTGLPLHGVRRERMASRRYRTYRGKGPKRLVVGIVCAVLLLAVGYGFVWIFEHLSLNADGTVTVNLPAFMAAPSATPTPKPTELLEIVLVPSEPPPSEESSAPPPDTLAPEPPPTASVMPAAPRAVFVPQTALADAAALESLKAEATAAVNGFAHTFYAFGVAAEPDCRNI